MQSSRCSRCQPLPFTRHPNSRIQAELEKQLGIESAESHVLAALSEGSFKKAFGKDRDLYLQQRRELLKTLTGLSSGSILQILDFAEQLAAEKTILPDILEIFQAFYRDVLMTLQGCGDEELVNLDLKDKIHRVSNRESVATTLAKLDALIEVRRLLDRNVNCQLAMEVLLLKLAA
jgi:DNA polymerase-3 subunit delta'